MMNAKRWIIWLVLFTVTALAGFLTQRFCYRFPTEAEMRAYHTGHFSTTLEQLDSIVLEKTDGSEVIVFKGKHLPSGQEEIYFVEAGKRWVFPWTDYNWKNEKKVEEKE